MAEGCEILVFYNIDPEWPFDPERPSFFYDPQCPFGGSFRVKIIEGHSGSIFWGHSGSIFKIPPG